MSADPDDGVEVLPRDEEDEEGCKRPRPVVALMGVVSAGVLSGGESDVIFGSILILLGKGG